MTLIFMKSLRHILLLAVVAMMIAACANIGTPEGGPRDYTPPRVVKSSPPAGTCNFKGNKVEITFNEIVNIKDQMKKVSVSPVQKDQPVIKSLGKKVVVEFRDEMQPNTTYTIDFSNSIEDNNEGNPLDGYAFSFSTGDDIDTMRISGIVLRACDLEPMQHILVGAYSQCLDDTAFTRLPMERVTRTNSRGEFTLMGLKTGRYRVFALNDMDGDYHMVRTEDYAFYDHIIEPSVSQYTSTDTIFTFDHRVDSVMTATHTAYLPNDVLLCMMNEDYKSLYLKKTERPTLNKLYVLLSTTSPELPKMEIIQPTTHAQKWYALQGSPRNDSLFYWITDSALIKSDSIKVALTYLRTDSTDALSWQTDTINFWHRKSGEELKIERELKKEQEEQAKRLRNLEEKESQGKLNDDEREELATARRPKPVPTIKLTSQKNGTIEVYDTLAFTTPVPLASVDPSRIHLAIKRDSVWIPIHNIPELCASVDGMTYQLPMLLMPDSAYRFTVDSLAVTDIYGMHNDSLKVDVKVRALEEYSNLLLHLNVTDHAFVQLLDGSDVVKRTATVVDGKVEFRNVPPATYYARVVLDRNGNGRWDTGNYLQHLQPEEVYYYPQPLKLRRNWDVDQQWNIYQTALDMQKPEAIKRNKPEQNKNKLDQGNRKKRGQNDEDEEEEEDEFNSRGFQNNSYSGNKYNDYQNQRIRK